jgi:hypothetical protein
LYIRQRQHARLHRSSTWFGHEEQPRGFRSATIREDVVRTTTRSFLYALGLDDEDVERPHVGVIHTVVLKGSLAPDGAQLPQNP